MLGRQIIGRSRIGSGSAAASSRRASAAGGAFQHWTPRKLAATWWIEPRRGNMVIARAGTGSAAVAEDDPVGFLRNLAASNHNFSASADSSVRPTLKGVGAVPYLNFAGASSQILTNNSGALTQLDGTQATWAFALRANSPATSSRLLSVGRGANDTVEYSLAAVLSTDATKAAAFIRNDGGAIQVNISTDPLIAAHDGTDRVLVVDDDGDNIRFFLDGVHESTIADYNRIGGYTLNASSLGGRAGATVGNFWSGRVYCAVACGRLLTSEEKDELTAYLGRIVGKSLPLPEG
jgi:hypothetical protein